jgi:hypothetical protein
VSYEGYRDVLNRHALPILGKLRADSVTTPQIQRLITSLSRDEDIDLEHGTLTINGSLGYIRRQGLVSGQSREIAAGSSSPLT